MVHCAEIKLTNVEYEGDTKFVIEEVKAAKESQASYGELIQGKVSATKEILGHSLSKGRQQRSCPPFEQI